MNYRHAFHAGNFADILKHVVLALCLDRLNAKDKPWRYIDTHAGTGLYDLRSDEARRSPEWEDGIARLWGAHHSAPDACKAALQPFWNVIQKLNPDSELNDYPGSPVIAQIMARENDAIRLCELHHESAENLKDQMARDYRIKIEERDGYEALIAYLPPPERRGVVLIDPPFEEGSADNRKDFARMLRAARKSIRRWPTGTFIFWRPLKNLDSVDAFDGDLATTVIEDLALPPEALMVADLWVSELDQPGPLAGAGVVIVNPPYGLKDHLECLLPWLTDLLSQSQNQDDSGAGFRIVAPEETP